MSSEPDSWVIEERLRCYLVDKQHRFVLKNFYISHWECDVFSVAAGGMTNEYEVKRTLSDYAQDFKKGCGEEKKHELIQSGGRTNKFWYVLPESLVVEVPEYAGVIRYKQDEEGYINLRKERNAKILHKQKLSECPKLLYNIALKCYYRMLNIQKEQHANSNPDISKNI